jgi:hypothetical protein
VGDKALASLVAYAAITTPGVVRLAPYLAPAVRRAVTETATRLTRRAAGGSPRHAGADPAAVEIGHDTGSDLIAVTVRIAATTDRPVLATVADLHTRIGAELTRAADTAAVVRVLVVDTVP